MTTTLYWHDYETFGDDPTRCRPAQFAGVRTTEKLEIIDEPLRIYCRPADDVLPSPDACLITGITPQTAQEKGVSEPHFMAEIHRELSRPGTCGVGYNSIRFDDEVTRYALFRNFYDPYEREWKNGNSRWDIIDMLRLARALRPEGIKWPEREDGYPSFRLEDLTRANGLSHEAAHDALSDVLATIGLARLVRERQPRLYEYVYRNRFKNRVATLLNPVSRKPVLHVSSKLSRDHGYTALMLPLSVHPVNSNAVIAFDLSADPRPLLELDAEAIRQRLFVSSEDLPGGIERIPLKAIHLNRCPIVATPRLLDEKAARRLNIDPDRCERHRKHLDKADVAAKLAEVFRPPEAAKATDPELRLYEGFIKDVDKKLLTTVRTSKARDLAVLRFPFQDSRYPELLLRYRARNFPDSLNAMEKQQYEEFRRQRLKGADGYLSRDAYRQRIAELRVEKAGDREVKHLLDQLSAWEEGLS